MRGEQAAQPAATIHADPNMKPETAQAFGEMVRLATEMVSKPICPKCGSSNVIPPGERYAAHTCEPCGYDFMPPSAPASADTSREGER